MSDVDGFILTISCPDSEGIVAAVSGFLARHACFITEAAQFSDSVSNRFFARMVFHLGKDSPTRADLTAKFEDVARPFNMDWKLHDSRVKSRVVILVSKFGHCLYDLLYRYHTNQLNVEIPAVISNHPDMRSIVEWHGIPYHYLAVDKHDKAAQEARVLDLIGHADADVVVLARYMQILSSDMCASLAGKAINIHHSFLPSFKGAKPYHQAYARGVKIIGATAHYVTPDLDEGPIIEQGVERVDHTATPEDLVSMGRDIENVVLARALRWHIQHRVLLNGAKTVVFK